MRSADALLRLITIGWVGLVAGCAHRATVISGFDVLALPGQPVFVRAKVERASLLRPDVEHPIVRFRIVQGPTAPIDLGTVRGDEDGVAAIQYKPAQPGNYWIECARLDRSGRPIGTGRLLLACRDGRRPMIAADIDGTLTLERGPLWSTSIRPYDRYTVEVINKLARQYDIIYLSGRLRYLLGQTRSWLRKNNLPDGPIFLLDPKQARTILPETFKKKTLRRLRRRTASIVAGIGNREADVDAYAAAGLMPILLGRADEEAISVRSWQEVGQWLLGRHLPWPLEQSFRTSVAGRRHRFRLRPDNGGVILDVKPRHRRAFRIRFDHWAQARQWIFAYLQGRASPSTQPQTPTSSANTSPATRGYVRYRGD